MGDTGPIDDIGQIQLQNEERYREAQEVAQSIPVDQEQPTEHGTRLRRGVAKITHNGTGGVYTIDEQLWDGAAWVDGMTPCRHMEAVARDFLDRASGQVDDIVRFWEQRQQNGALEVLIDVRAGTADTPAVILPAAFENETAQTDTWDRANPPSGKDGLTVKVQMRTAYVHDGDEKLYAFYRTFTYDSCGGLLTISAETRVEVDVPGECP